MAVMGLQTKANFYILVLSHRVTCTSSCHVTCNFNTDWLEDAGTGVQ